jgi:hypothetical protein
VVIPLSRAYGQARIETGLVIMRDRAARLLRPSTSETGWLKSVAYHHEWIHYLQSITCASVHHVAQRVLALSAGILSAGASTTPEMRDELGSLTTEIYGRRFDGEHVRVHERPGMTILQPLAVPDSHEIGMLDLLEGVAVLESFKLCTEGATVNDFLRFRDDYFPGELRSPYRWTFNWLGSEVGPEAAYELLAPVTYASLQHPDPAAAFVELCGDPSDAAAPTTWLSAFEHGEPEAGHVTLDPCIAAAVAELGASELARIGAMPSRLTPEHVRALSPPLTVFAGEGGLESARAEYADDRLAAQVLAWTACAGAAERLALSPDADVYRFCPHLDACPHAHSALCHRHFAPPPEWRSCSFIALVERFAGMAPDALWAATGRGLKPAGELIAAFEATTESDVAELCRLQRGSLIALAGEDGYEELRNQCDMVADQALRALRTQDMDELVTAKMFHGAVVEQVRRLSP